MRSVIGNMRKSIQHLLRRIKIRETLREIDRTAGIADARHTANDRIGKSSDTVT